MLELRLRYNKPDYSNPPTLHLYGVAPAAANAVTGRIYWRWEDEPTMPPALLGEALVGTTLTAPLPNPEGRQVRLYLIGRSDVGESSVDDLSKAAQLVVTPPEPPTLADLDFDDPNNENDLVIAANGGTGSINIFRKIGTSDFALIASVAYTTTAYSNPVTLDGTYYYKLTQDGIEGESNTLSVVVSGVGSPAGSPPSGLTASHDANTTSTLNWTNNGGTGSNIIERRLNFDDWTNIGSVSSSTATYNDTAAVPGTLNRTYYYRVRNESVEGYSNEAQVYVEGTGLP